MTIKSYRDLEVWKKSISLIKNIYEITESYPKKETYGLGSQTERSAVSIAANIAEGRGRNSTREFLRHISFAYGSLAECETHLFIAKELNYISQENLNKFIGSTEEIGRMLNGLSNSLRKRLTPDLRPLTPNGFKEEENEFEYAEM